MSTTIKSHCHSLFKESDNSQEITELRAHALQLGFWEAGGLFHVKKIGEMEDNFYRKKKCLRAYDMSCCEGNNRIFSENSDFVKINSVSSSTIKFDEDKTTTKNSQTIPYVPSPIRLSFSNSVTSRHRPSCKTNRYNCLCSTRLSNSSYQIFVANFHRSSRMAKWWQYSTSGNWSLWIVGRWQWFFNFCRIVDNVYGNCLDRKVDRLFNSAKWKENFFNASIPFIPKTIFCRLSI